ncbi:hypothetical protein JCM17380_13410 [Desulfosporosinus burensis]
MESIRIIPQKIEERIDEMIELSWTIFVNQFLSNKYAINLEAPFQLHFSTILKSVGEMYCLNKDESFHINLEVNMGEQKKNYVDIVVEYCIGSSNETYKIPIELKYRTISQSAEDIGVMEIYKDIYSLDKITSRDSEEDCIIPFSYFFCITNNSRYIKAPGYGLKTVFKTYNEAEIEASKEYKYQETKEGKKFFDKYGALTFNKPYKFLWHEGDKLKDGEKYWFLKMRINR